MNKQLIGIARLILPLPVYDWLGTRWRGEAYCPPVGRVRFGNLRRTHPLSREYGYDRGTPIDRYYIEKFLAACQSDIRGRVLEVADNVYTLRFGGDRVTKSDVLHVEEGHPDTTIVADLTSADSISDDNFDCIILTQTLQFIYDVASAVRTVHRILKPGGVALVTLSGISQVSGYDMERWGHYWNFTSLSAKSLFEEVFQSEKVQVDAFGNVLAATAFLFGMAVHELRPEELEFCDDDYQLLITVRAVK